MVAAGLLLCGCKQTRLPDEPVPRQTSNNDERSVLGFRVTQPAVIYGLARHVLAGKPSTGSRRVGALPQSLPVLVVSLLGLPPLAAGRLADHGDWIGLVSRTPLGAAAWAIAVPLHSGREFIAEQTLGANAPRRAVERKGFIELQGPNLGALGAMCVGVSSNRLVFGPSCLGVEALVGHLTGESSIAPATVGPGLGLRLFAGRNVLQGLYALWGDRSWQLLGAVGSELDEIAFGSLGDVLTLLNARVSAYLAHIETAEVRIELDGSRVVLEGSARASSLPVPSQPRSLCRALSVLPSQTRLWMAGIGEHVPTRSPDWEQFTGQWEQSVVKSLAYTLGPTSTEDGVNPRKSTNAQRPLSGLPLTTRQSASPGQWVIGAREGGAGLTFFALLEAQTPAQVEALMPTSAATGLASRVPSVRGAEPEPQVVNRDGRALEWGGVPWGSGVAVAVGAPLGDEWQRWLARLRTPPADPVTREVPCHGAVGGIGARGGTELVVMRVAEGLELKGRWDVTGQWSTR